MSHAMLTPHLVQSWLELPFLVDQFIQGVAPAVRCSRSTLRDSIAEDIGLDTYEDLGRVCRTMAEVFELLVAAHEDVDVGRKVLDQDQAGLAAVVVRAWKDAGEDLSGLQTIDPSEIEPMQTLPWREWAAWRERGDQGGQAGDDESQETAYSVLDEFMVSCYEWRQDILDSYTLVHEGTPLGLDAIAAADALIEQGSSLQGKARDQLLKSVLSARGFYGVPLDVVRLLTPPEAAGDPSRLVGWMLKRHQALLERVEIGKNVLQVRELREHFRWLAPDLVGDAYEDGPCMWQVLARLNDDAYVEVSQGSGGKVARLSIAPFATVYVERTGEIAATLRCTGVGARGMHIVTRSEALHEGLPQLAGWFAIRWWE